MQSGCTAPSAHARRRRRRRAGPRARARPRLVDQRVDGLVVVPARARPAAAGRRSPSRSPTVTIGDALPGVAPAGEVVFDNERGVEETPAATSASWATGGHRPLVGGRDVARPRGRARGRARARSARSRLSRRPRLLAERVAPARARVLAGPTARPRVFCLRTRSPTASTPPAPSSGSRSPRRRRRRLRRPPDLAAADAAADVDVLTSSRSRRRSASSETISEDGDG